MASPAPPPARPDSAANVGLLVASAMAPGTFAPSLSARSAVDQGIVTGLSTGLHYLLTVGTQDALQAAAAELAAAGPAAAARTRRAGSAADACWPTWPRSRSAWRVQRALPARPGEADAARAAPPGGLAVRGDRHRRRPADRHRGRAAERSTAGSVRGGRIAGLPVAVPVGLGVAYVLERRRQREARSRRPSPRPTDPPPPLRPLGIAGGVVGGLAGARLRRARAGDRRGPAAVRGAARRPAAVEADRATRACLGALGAGGYSVYGAAPCARSRPARRPTSR